MTRQRVFRDLPLVWKLLLPYLALVVAVGSFGTFLLVRDLHSRADASTDRELTRRSLEVEELLHERALYVRESATLAANLQGMGDVVSRRDRGAASRLLASVLALKTDLAAVAVTDAKGDTLSGFGRSSPDASPVEQSSVSWASIDVVRVALASGNGASSTALVARDGIPLLLVASPVCTAPTSCGAVGATIAAVDLRRVAPSGTSLFDANGHRLASSGRSAPVEAEASVPDSKLVRRSVATPRGSVPAAFAPISIDGRRLGTFGVSAPDASGGSVAGTAWRIALLVALAIGGVVGIGALLSRFILAQVRPLVATNRALGAGDLSVRAPVLGDDELGELARGVNQMAEQLQSSYETLEERVRARTAEVEQLLQERTELFTSVSHEFRTPLAIVLAQAEALQDPTYAKTDRWCAEVGRMVEESGQQLLRFVNDVLALARAEAGAVDVHLDEVSIGAVLGELRDSFEGLASSAGVALSIKARRDLPPVCADRDRLREVLMNLVDNAVKYTPIGGRVTVTAAAADGGVEVLVADTGVGIPTDVGERIFEPFFRVQGTRTQRDEPSSGLGLALTRRLVEAQGGTIGFEPRRGGGTVFRVTFR